MQVITLRMRSRLQVAQAAVECSELGTGSTMRMLLPYIVWRELRKKGGNNKAYHRSVIDDHDCQTGDGHRSSASERLMVSGYFGNIR